MLITSASAASTGYSMFHIDRGSRIILAAECASIVKGVVWAAFGLQLSSVRLLIADVPGTGALQPIERVNGIRLPEVGRCSDALDRDRVFETAFQGAEPFSRADTLEEGTLTRLGGPMRTFTSYLRLLPSWHERRSGGTVEPCCRAKSHRHPERLLATVRRPTTTAQEAVRPSSTPS